MAIGIVLSTLDGVSLNPGSGAYTTRVELGMLRQQTGQIAAGSVDLSAADPYYGGQTRQPRTIYVWHEIAGGGGSTYEANLAAVKGFYDPRHGERALALEIDGVACTARVKLLRIVPGSESRRGPVKGEWLLLSHVMYASAAATTGPTSKSALPAQLSVTNAGNVLTTSVTHSLKPTSQKAATAGMRYRLPVTLANKAGRGGQHAIEFTGGGWDHAAEVTATRSRSDGADVEVYVNGTRTMHWAGASTSGFNNAATKLWGAVDLEPARYWTLAAAVADSATTLMIKERLVNMPALPFFAVIDGSTDEPILVTDYDADALTFTVARGQRGVTAAAQSADVLIYKAITIDVVYGWTSGHPAQTYIDSRFKPLAAESASSTNGAWTFAYYMQSGSAGLNSQPYPRPGTWRLKPMRDTDRKDIYTKWIPWTASLGGNADPATDMAIGYDDDGARAGQPLTEAWVFSSVIGMSQIDYRHVTSTLTMGPGSPPQEGRLEVWATLRDGTRIRTRTAENTGATSSTDTFSVVPALEVGFYVHPWDPTNTEYNTAEGVAALEPTDNDGLLVDNVVVTFATAETPLVVPGARQSIYQFGRPGVPATLICRDSASGEITMNLHGVIVKIDDTLRVNALARTVTIDTGEACEGLWSGELPGVQPGAVTVEYNDAAIGAVTMTTALKAGYM